MGLRLGILAGAAALIEDNQVSSNTGAGVGIHTTGNRNRIHGNSVIGHSVAGIKVDGAGSLIVRNTLSGNASPMAIAAGNAWAQLVTPGPGS